MSWCVSQNISKTQCVFVISINPEQNVQWSRKIPLICRYHYLGNSVLGICLNHKKTHKKPIETQKEGKGTEGSKQFQLPEVTKYQSFILFAIDFVFLWFMQSLVDIQTFLPFINNRSNVMSSLCFISSGPRVKIMVVSYVILSHLVLPVIFSLLSLPPTGIFLWAFCYFFCIMPWKTLINPSTCIYGSGAKCDGIASCRDICAALTLWRELRCFIGVVLL